MVVGVHADLGPVVGGEHHEAHAEDEGAQQSEHRPGARSEEAHFAQYDPSQRRLLGGLE